MRQPAAQLQDSEEIDRKSHQQSDTSNFKSKSNSHPIAKPTGGENKPNSRCGDRSFDRMAFVLPPHTNLGCGVLDVCEFDDADNTLVSVPVVGPGAD